MEIRHYIFIIVIIIACSCNNSQIQGPVEKKIIADKMVDINKFLVEKDNEQINKFIDSQNLEMVQTQSGLWYNIIRKGTGANFVDGNSVTIDYSSSLLDGTKCYSSTERGDKVVVISKSDIESGLNEGLKLLNPGSEAMFILPPYLAFGLLGDGKNIPARSVIVYNVKVKMAESLLE